MNNNFLCLFAFFAAILSAIFLSHLSPSVFHPCFIRGEISSQVSGGLRPPLASEGLRYPTCEEGGDAKLREAVGANAGLTTLCKIELADFCITEKIEGAGVEQISGSPRRKK